MEGDASPYLSLGMQRNIDLRIQQLFLHSAGLEDAIEPVVEDVDSESAPRGYFTPDPATVIV